MLIMTWYRRMLNRREADRRRRAWQRLSPEAQAALLIDFIGRNKSLRRDLRRALGIHAAGKPDVSVEV
jgi:hypothetical protein